MTHTQCYAPLPREGLAQGQKLPCWPCGRGAGQCGITYGALRRRGLEEHMLN
jgi:hypothetical protein